MSWFKKIFKKEEKETLDKGLEKSSQGFFEKISKAVVGKSVVDEEVLDDLEEVLIASDVGASTTIKIIERIEQRVARDKFVSTDELDEILRQEITGLLLDNPHAGSGNIDESKKPYVIMVVGVNGVGQTTTIGKLAYQFKSEGKKVVLGAADTFRAGAIDQLVVWGERADVEVIRGKAGGDPAAVVFDAMVKAKEKQADILLVDTAGRLQNKAHLMQELDKIKRIIQREEPNAPHEVLLVLDATTGQNAMSQAKQFKETTDVTGLVLTKLDGTAKGGIVLAIRNELHLPVKLVGLGEGIEDLEIFNPNDFVIGLFKGLLEEE